MHDDAHKSLYSEIQVSELIIQLYCQMWFRAMNFPSAFPKSSIIYFANGPCRLNGRYTFKLINQ